MLSSDFEFQPFRTTSEAKRSTSDRYLVRTPLLPDTTCETFAEADGVATHRVMATGYTTNVYQLAKVYVDSDDARYVETVTIKRGDVN